jgi:predicted nucleotidyltransferase
MEAIDAVARRFVGLLDESAIPYAIMGGFAVRLYGLPRATFDVDFVAILDRERLFDLYSASEQLGFGVPDAQKTGWIESVHGYPVVRFQWWVDKRSFDLDVFLAESEFLTEVVQRRIKVETEGVSAWYVTAEDLILLKLLAGRKKDQADVSDILLVQGQLDEAYLRDWAVKLSVAAQLESALSERPD